MSAPSRRPLALLALDALAVVAFAATGRASHDESLDLLAVLGTAAPFLAGLAAAWAVLAATSTSARGWRGWAVTWVLTVTLGMVTRRVLGDGTDPAFVMVALLAVGLLLALVRGVWTLIARRFPAPGPPGQHRRSGPSDATPVTRFTPGGLPHPKR